MKIELLFWDWEDNKLNDTAYKPGQKINDEDKNLIRVNDHTFKLKNLENVSITHNKNLIVESIHYFKTLPLINGQTSKSNFKDEVISFLNKHLKKANKPYKGDILMVIFREEILSSAILRRSEIKIDPDNLKSVLFT